MKSITAILLVGSMVLLVFTGMGCSSDRPARVSYEDDYFAMPDFDAPHRWFGPMWVASALTGRSVSIDGMYTTNEVRCLMNWVQEGMGDWHYRED